MNRYFKIVVIMAMLFLAYMVCRYSPIFVGQKRFYEIQSKIKVGMKRELVLALAEDIGYFKHVAGQGEIEKGGKAIRVNNDSFSYANFILTSELIIDYNSNDEVEKIFVDE